MTGVDANVFLRSIARDLPDAARTADRFLGQLTAENPGFVSLLTVCEVAWGLRRSYGYSRAIIVAILRGMLDSAELRVERPSVVASAINGFEEGGAGFSDHFIAALHAEAGAEETVTFDRKASRLPGWRLLG